MIILCVSRTHGQQIALRSQLKSARSVKLFQNFGIFWKRVSHPGDLHMSGVFVFLNWILLHHDANLVDEIDLDVLQGNAKGLPLCLAEQAAKEKLFVTPLSSSKP